VLDDSWRPGLRQLLIPATELLGSRYSSERGACGFVRVADTYLCLDLAEFFKSTGRAIYVKLMRRRLHRISLRNVKLVPILEVTGQ
jgi:hypothetical protein